MADYIEYLYQLTKHHGLNDDDVEFSQSLYRKLVSREYMENGRSSTKDGMLDKLLETADAIDASTVEGAIASAFIYHQVAEEWLYDFLELIRFFLALKIYPDRIQHKPSDTMQLAALTTEIEASIDFENKEELVKYARLVNQYRTRFAHDLLKKNSVEEIQRDFEKFMEHFDRMYKALEGTDGESYGARDHLLEKVKQFNKWSDEFHDKHRFILEELLESADVAHLTDSEYEAEDAEAQPSGVEDAP